MANEEQLAAESAQRAAVEVPVDVMASQQGTTPLRPGPKAEEVGCDAELIEAQHVASGRVEKATDPETVEGVLDEVDGGIDGAHSLAKVAAGPRAVLTVNDLAPIDETEIALPESQRDTEVAAEALAGSDSAAADDMSELRRLRDLVFASRGSRSNLPPGWEDDAVDQSTVPAKKESVATLPREAKMDAVGPSKALVDEAAQKMLQRAIDVVGQYASDSDSDEDSSDSDSDSSSVSASSASPFAGKERTTQKKATTIQGGISDDEEDGGTVGASGPRTKNEVIEPTVDQPPYSSVPVDKELRSLGKIHSIVDCVVVIAQDVGKAPGQPNYQATGSSHGNRPAPVDMHGRKGEEEGEYSVLDTGSLLAFADRSVLGVVFETFGSVLSPLYALRYSSASQVNKDMIQVGKPVFYVPSDSTYVLTRALRALGKGSDASNLWDEEIGDDEREFSDDEAEAEHKRNAKAGKSKSKKRSHPGENAALGNDGRAGPSRPIKHCLPSRPMMAPPVHRDAASSQQSMTLMYDDEETAPRQPATVHQPSINMYSPAMPHSTHHAGASLAPHDPYALWQYQQQQQEYQPYLQQSPLPPTLHHYPQSYQQPMQHQHYPSGPPSGLPYNPQQPYLGPRQPPQ